MTLSLLVEEGRQDALRKSLTKEIEEFGREFAVGTGMQSPFARVCKVRCYRYDTRFRSVVVGEGMPDRSMLVIAEVDAPGEGFPDFERRLSECLQSKLGLENPPFVESYPNPSADTRSVVLTDRVPAGNREIVRKAPPFVR